MAFAMFDKDGDGAISSNELVHVMRSLRADCDSKEVQSMVRRVDLDGE